MLKRLPILALCCLLVAPTLADQIPVMHFATQAEVDSYVVGGYDFFARADHEATTVRIDEDVYSDTIPGGVWLDDADQAFRVTYDATNGRVGITFADGFSTTTELTLTEADALLVQAYADVPAATVTVKNMAVRQGMDIYQTDPPATQVSAAGEGPNAGFLLLDMRELVDLTESWRLGGQVSFAWEGDPPAAASQWFQVTPVRIPEPTSCALVILGFLFSRRRG